MDILIKQYSYEYVNFIISYINKNITKENFSKEFKTKEDILKVTLNYIKDNKLDRIAKKICANSCGRNNDNIENVFKSEFDRMTCIIMSNLLKLETQNKRALYNVNIIGIFKNFINSSNLLDIVINQINKNFYKKKIS